MEDVHRVGGIPAVMKYLLAKGLLHGGCLTVTGKTIAENLAEVDGLQEGKDVIMQIETPIKDASSLAETTMALSVTSPTMLFF